MNDWLKQLFVDALLAYIEMREIHIDTKTVSTNVHSKTEEFYELLFDISHTIWERYVDLWNNLRDDHWDCPVQTEKIVWILTWLRDRLSSVLPELSKDPSMIWLDNLLRWHIDKLEFNIWNAKALEFKFKMKQDMWMWMWMWMKWKWSEQPSKEEVELHEQW